MINPFKPGSQAYRLFELLQHGPATNAEIIKDLNIFNYTGRISDLREKGINVVARNIRKGLWEYTIVPPVVAGQQSFIPMEGGTNA
jgi:Helix-turn-helix domain